MSPTAALSLATAHRVVDRFIATPRLCGSAEPAERPPYRYFDSVIEIAYLSHRGHACDAHEPGSPDGSRNVASPPLACHQLCRASRANDLRARPGFKPIACTTVPSGMLASGMAQVGCPHPHPTSPHRHSRPAGGYSASRHHVVQQTMWAERFGSYSMAATRRDAIPIAAKIDRPVEALVAPPEAR